MQGGCLTTAVLLWRFFMKTADPFYKSTKWKHKRLAILRRDKYRCQLSKRYGKTVQAELVHHIFPREEFPEYEFEDWNLISISNIEHNKLHSRDSEMLTEAGKELLRRTARRRGMEIPEQYE